MPYRAKFLTLGNAQIHLALLSLNRNFSSNILHQIMTDFDELKQIKAQCLRDITEALPDYVNRLNSIDTRLLPYVEDAISNI